MLYRLFLFGAPPPRAVRARVCVAGVDVDDDDGGASAVAAVAYLFILVDVRNRVFLAWPWLDLPVLG